MSEIEESVADLNEEYEILGELGRGGSAIVYHGRDRDLGREVAIKVVRPRYGAGDDDSLQRLAREARTVAGLQHPNIVTVYAVKRLEEGGLALVMQLVPGLTLKQTIVANGPMSPADTEGVVRDVASALAYAHAHGVVHRDVKPENIFLDAVTGRALLSDFGIAHSTEFDSRLTMTGTAIGTPAYMSPEQIDGKPTDPRSDVYSLGLVSWEMLTGQRPWEGETLYNVIYKQKHDQLPAIDALRAGVPLRLQYMVERMLQKRPGARWAGAAGLLGFMDASVLPSDWTQWQDAHKRRRARVAAAAAAPAKPAGFINAALATVRFRRGDVVDAPPAESAAGDAAVDTLPVPVDESTSMVIDQQFDDGVGVWDDTWDGDDGDTSPSWVRNSPPPKKRSRATMLAGAALVIAMAGTLFTLSRRGNGSLGEPTSILTDVGSVQVPMGLPPMSPAGDSLRNAQDDSVRTAQIDSAASAVRDSMVAAEQARLAAATPITASSNGALAPVSQRSQTTPVPPPSSGNSAAGSNVTSSTGAAAMPPAPTGAITPGRSSAPSTPESSAAAVRATDDRGIVAAGGRHSCVLDDGRVLCWGSNESGQLGDGDFDARSLPQAVTSELEFTSLAAGSAHSCGLTRSGDAYCWGNDDFGQLGDATTTSRSAPVRVAGSHTFRALRAGKNHTCGLTTSNMIACWGANSSGQVGDNTTANRSSPLLLDAGVRFVSVATGSSHSCGIATDGIAYCWGDNSAGQLGDGSRTRRLSPQPVGSAVRFTSIAAGSTHTCAVAESGDAYCWGGNSVGQLGTGDALDRTMPTRTETSARFASITTGLVHSCGRTRSGEAYCWGANVYGQLGDGTNANRTTPVRVAAGTFSSINASGAHTCGATSDGAMSCWGYNKDGQLGDGSRNHRSRPLRVAIPAK